VLRDGYGSDEVEAARQSLLQSRRLGRAQDGGLAGLLAEYLRLDRTMAFSAQSDARIAAATPVELLDALRRHIDPKQLTVVFAGDFSKSAGSDRR
jgi:zinc protease